MADYTIGSSIEKKDIFVRQKVGSKEVYVLQEETKTSLGDGILVSRKKEDSDVWIPVDKFDKETLNTEDVEKYIGIYRLGDKKEVPKTIKGEAAFDVEPMEDSVGGKMLVAHSKVPTGNKGEYNLTMVYGTTVGMSLTMVPGGQAINLIYNNQVSQIDGPRVVRDKE
jgi:hypothetical protein